MHGLFWASRGRRVLIHAVSISWCITGRRLLKPPLGLLGPIVHWGLLGPIGRFRGSPAEWSRIYLMVPLRRKRNLARHEEGTQILDFSG